MMCPLVRCCRVGSTIIRSAQQQCRAHQTSSSTPSCICSRRGRILRRPLSSRSSSSRTDNNDNFLRHENRIVALASKVSPRALHLVRTAFREQRDELLRAAAALRVSSNSNNVQVGAAASASAGAPTAGSASTTTTTPQHQQRPLLPTTGHIFANRELDMGQMGAIGFDYDYTLASYKTALQHLIYDEAKQFLVTEGGYPSQLADLMFEKDFAVRGLMFDRRTGMLLKLSFFQRITIGRAFLGRRRVSRDELMRAYGSNLHMSRFYIDTHCVWVNDLFSLSEACLLSDVVQLALDEGIDFDPFALQQDVQKAISHVHSSGIMRSAVQQRPELFLHANPELKPLLRRWRDSNKQLFLLTNSSFPFVNAGMSYIMDDVNWRDLFDIVITNASKPRFFVQDTPFRCLNQQNATSAFAMWHPVTQNDLDRVLVGGSVERLSQLAGWEDTNVVYFGDHLHSDLVEPRRILGWYTGAIIRELESEFQIQQRDEYKQFLTTVCRVEALLNDVQTDESSGNTDALQTLLDALETVRMELYTCAGNLFNRHFGTIFRSLGHPSAYALALFKGCDIYTTRIENFSHYLPSHRFYPNHTDHLPHEKLYLSNGVLGARERTKGVHVIH